MAAAARWSGGSLRAAPRLLPLPLALPLRQHVRAGAAADATQWAQQAWRMRGTVQRRAQGTYANPAGYGAPPPRQRSLTGRILWSTTRFVLMTIISGAAGISLALVFIPKPVFDAFWAFTRTKRMTAAESLAQLDQELAEGASPETRAINDLLTSHPLAQEMRAASGQWKEQRPHMKIPAALRPTNLTAGTLAGPGRITVPPLVFSSVDPVTGKHDGQKLVVLLHLGPQLCGHPGIVHGGLLATLLDECLARCCFPALPNKMGVTANLTVNYRKPAMAAQPSTESSSDGSADGGFFVLRAETTRVDGRKAWVRGHIEELPVGSKLQATEAAKTLAAAKGRDEGNASGPEQETTQEQQKTKKKRPGKTVVEAEALFVEPRQAAALGRLYADPD